MQGNKTIRTREADPSEEGNMALVCLDPSQRRKQMGAEDDARRYEGYQNEHRRHEPARGGKGREEVIKSHSCRRKGDAIPSIASVQDSCGRNPYSIHEYPTHAPSQIILLDTEEGGHVL